MPIEPPPSRWLLPQNQPPDEQGIVGVGADLEPGTLLAAYRAGMFPMPLEGLLAWWSPDPRGVLPLAGLRVSRSLRRSVRKYETTVNHSFHSVITACAGGDRDGNWISSEMLEAYVALHELGWAHSVEAWDGDELVGGLYGVAIGGFFAGESMFHRVRDASKVALVTLVDLLHPQGLLDVQWVTDHLASLGAIEVPREMYLSRLEAALRLPLPPVLAAGSRTDR